MLHPACGPPQLLQGWEFVWERSRIHGELTCTDRYLGTFLMFPLLLPHHLPTLFPPQSSADQGETKSPQSNPPSKMIPPKQPMYPIPPQASSPYPGLGSFLSPSDLQSYRGHPHAGLSRTLPSKPLLPSISASPPPSFQISPPLHQQLSLHHPQSSLLPQPLSMQQVPQQPLLSPPPMALQVQPPINASPPGQQVSAGGGFPVSGAGGWVLALRESEGPEGLRGLGKGLWNS